jgi:hypothetical protein
MRTTAASLLLVFSALLFGATLSAAETETPFSTLSRLASYLSENDAASASDIFDHQMKGYGELENNLEALAAQTDVSCAIDVVSEVEDGPVHKLDLDWLVTLRGKTDTSQVERRRERVQVEMRQIKGKWKITAMAPQSVLSAIVIR